MRLKQRSWRAAFLRASLALAAALLWGGHARAGVLTGSVLVAAGPILPPLDSEDASAPGGEIAELLALQRRLNPEIAAAILDRQAAEAAARAAGAPDDPEISVALEDVDRNRSGLPERVGSIHFEIEQRFPWWGKRGLQREIGRSEAAETRAEAHLTQVRLEARLKETFADAWLAAQAIAVTQRSEDDLERVVELAYRRYGLGLADRGDVADAEIAVSSAKAERTHATAALVGAKAQLNALLDRPPEAVLDDPNSLPALPAEDRLLLPALLDRARLGNPSLAASRASAAAARDSRRLAEKSWYPDVTAGLAVVERRFDGEDGYEARLGIAIPLQGGVRRARIAEAAARQGAAELRLRSEERAIEAGLASALAALAAARERSALLAADLRQGQAAAKAAESAYVLGRTSLAEVIAARQLLRQIELEHLGEQATQRRLLAEIEALIGGEL